MPHPVLWRLKSFTNLSNAELYSLLKLRVDTFVVEQNCSYADLDNKDLHPQSLHLFAVRQNQTKYLENTQDICGYCRILSKGLSYPDAISIGRIVIAKDHRGKKLGQALIQEALKVCHTHFPHEKIKISAQTHLKSLYEKQGFICTQHEYLEDGIPHVLMQYTAKI